MNTRGKMHYQFDASQTIIYCFSVVIFPAFFLSFFLGKYVHIASHPFSTFPGFAQDSTFCIFIPEFITRCHLSHLQIGHQGALCANFWMFYRKKVTTILKVHQEVLLNISAGGRAAVYD